MKTRKLLTKATIAIVLILSILCFQNCGEFSALDQVGQNQLASTVVLPGIATPVPAPVPAPVAACSGTTYYVAANGNDANNGMSPSAPWQTIAKVNAGSSYAGGGLSPGQCLMFNGGDQFSGCVYMATGSNIASSSASNPIVLGSYGSGNATITGTLACQNSGVSNNKWGVVMIDGANAALSGFIMQNLTLRPGNGYGNGVIVQATGAGINNVIVRNNDIGGFNTPNNNPFGSAEILVLDAPNEPVGGGGTPIYNIQVINNSVHGLSGVTSADASGIMFDGVITSSLISGNSVYNIGSPGNDTGAGITILNDNKGPANVVVSSNTIHDIGANTTSCGGMSGIETANVDTIIVSSNEVYNTRPYPSLVSGCDWDGIDLDGSTVNSIVEYNYTHNNFGTGLFGWMGLNNGPIWGNNIFRYNISENDNNGGSTSGGAMSFAGQGNAVSGLQVYNNTIYQFNTNGSNAAVSWVGWNAPTGSIFKNNILMTSANNVHTSCNLYSGGNMDLSGISFSTNGYAGSSGSDWGYCGSGQAETLTSDPSFSGTVPVGTLNGSLPGPASYVPTNGAYIGTGTAISSSGGRDYYGNTVPSGTSGYNIGAY